MIVDTSAAMSILLREPDSERFLDQLIASPSTQISAATVTETYVVLLRKEQPALIEEMDLLIREFRIAIRPHTAMLAQRTLAAYRDFGQGSGHPAKLNFGDCFTYALAAEMDEPILCKGDDFIHTDRAVVPV